jgi:FkbM family methyltransferase
VSLRDSLKRHVPAPAWQGLRALAGKRDSKERLLVALAARRSLRDAPVPAAWKRNAVKTQLRLALSQPGVACRVRIGQFEIAGFSPDRLAYLHREIFVALAYYFHAERRAPLIVDGGANIGMSVVFFKMLYPNARVLAFEPAERAYEFLGQNVGALPGVELHRLALGRENAVVPFYDFADYPGSLRQSTRQERLTAPRQTTVEQRRLSDFLDGQPVDLLKLDIEGAEQDVIEELRDSGAIECVKQLIVEYHHQLNPDRDSVGSFLEGLHDLGFHYQLSAYEAISYRETLEPRFQDVLIHAYRRQAHWA